MGIAILTALNLAACAAGGESGTYRREVDGDGISAPLDGLTGNADRGRARVMARDPANCLLCHAMPGATLAGNVGPSLAGVGRRFTVAQLRLRVADEKRVVPNTIMPSYFRTEGLTDVAPEFRGRTILDAQAVEDVVAYLRMMQ
jgi:sulfur-oxidizing protein SoxX